MYKIFPLLLMLFTSMAGKSQLDKGTWLVGGNGSLQSTKTETRSDFNDYNANVLNISVQPNIGYFLADKLAAGLRISYEKERAKLTESNIQGGTPYNITRFYIGPFVRYYFLETEKPFNLLADVNYSPGIYRSEPSGKGNFSTFTAAFGPVVYFNSSVGLEFLVGYYLLNEDFTNNNIQFENKKSGLQVSIGFQFHLEK